MIIATFLLSVFCLAPQEALGAPAMSFKDLMAVKWISQVTLSSDGKWAAFVRKEASYKDNKHNSNIFLVSTSGKVGALRQLTNTPGSNSSPAFSPDGKKLAFISSRGEGEAQIWIIPLHGGEAIQLTKISTGASGPVWSPDGRMIAFVSSVFPDCKDDACNAKRLKKKEESKVKARIFDHLLIRHWNHWRDERRDHILVVPATGGKPRDMTPGPHDAPPISLGGSPDYAFSPDSKRLAYVTNTDKVVATSTNNDLFEVPLKGGKAKRITTGKGNDNSPRYSPDGRFLAYLSMARAGFESDRPRILVRDRKSGKVQEWTRAYAGHPIDLIWAPDSKQIYFNAPHHGQLEIFSAAAAGVKQLSKGLYAKDLNVSPDGRTLVFSNQSANHAPEVTAIPHSGKGPRSLTTLNDWLTKKRGLLPAEHVWYKGAGGAQIHAMLVKPPGFKKGRRYPAMVMIHGGPQGMTGNSFHPRWNLQMFAAKGYVIVGVNFHGSVGFGQAFTDSISGDWGGKPYQDVMLGLKHLKSLPFIKAKKVCAAGASYGGYMINWIATHNDKFQCLISHAGVFNLESKYGSTEELWFPEWDFKGTPWSNRAHYRKMSPHSYAEGLKTPTLVIHGQKDYRVPVEQGLQIFTALQRQGVPSRLLYFPDEDHFVRKPHNIELWWKTMRGWLGRYLR